MNPEKNNILDMSSDIVMSGVILSLTLLYIKKGFGPDEAKTIISYMGCSTLWKLSSPFSHPEKIGWRRYVWVLVLLSTIVGIPFLIFHL